MNLKDKFGVAYKAVRLLPNAVPKYVKNYRGYCIEGTINDDYVAFWHNPLNPTNAYFYYADSWWIIYDRISFVYNDFTVDKVKPKQLRKKTRVPFVRSSGIDKELVCKDSEAFGDKNSCTVISISHAFNIPYAEAYEIMRSRGRIHGQGVYMSIVLQNPIVVNGLKTEAYYGFTERTVASFVKNHPQGTYLICIRAHIMCCKDGVIYDTIYRPKGRITNVWRINNDGI